jgi:hypothetical protein
MTIIPNTLISDGLLWDTCKIHKLKVRNYSGSRANGRMILKWICEKTACGGVPWINLFTLVGNKNVSVRGGGLGSAHSGQDQVVRSCEHGSDATRCINRGELLTKAE